MKLLVILALALVTMGQDPPIKYYEPEALPCYCAGCGDPGLNSFDGASLMVFTNQKTMVSGWGQFAANATSGIKDICKFGLRAVTKESPTKSGTYYYDWMGFGYGFRPVAEKTWRNVQFAQNTKKQALVAIRGSGFKGPAKIKRNPSVQKQTDTSNGQVCYWKTEEHSPNLVTFRSNCCPYAFNWRPSGETTCWELYVGDKYRDNGLTGMCGNCDRNIVNDFRGCPKGPVYGPPVTGHLHRISNNCSSGVNQGDYFSGGQRLGDLPATTA